jgi:hypothetical protein
MEARLKPETLGVGPPERRRIHENLKAYIERHDGQNPLGLLRRFQLRREHRRSRGGHRCGKRKSRLNHATMIE